MEHMMIRILPALTIALLASGAWAQSSPPAVVYNAPLNPAVKLGGVKESSALAAGYNSFTQEQARARIAKAGYANVSPLKKDDTGLWQGTATRECKTVHVALDYKGNIASD
jgi:hypothetical protein